MTIPQSVPAIVLAFTHYAYGNDGDAAGVIDNLDRDGWSVFRSTVNGFAGWAMERAPEFSAASGVDTFQLTPDDVMSLIDTHIEPNHKYTVAEWRIMLDDVFALTHKTRSATLDKEPSVPPTSIPSNNNNTVAERTADGGAASPSKPLDGPNGGRAHETSIPDTSPART